MKYLYLFSLLALLASAAQAQTLQVEHINPASGFSQVVAVTTGKVKTLYVSGQIGEGTDLATQIESAFKNVEKQLAASGAAFTDIVKMNTYIVNYKPETDLAIFRGVRARLYGDKKMPASTLVGVQALGVSEWLIEIEAIAVVEIP